MISLKNVIYILFYKQAHIIKIMANTSDISNDTKATESEGSELCQCCLLHKLLSQLHKSLLQ